MPHPATTATRPSDVCGLLGACLGALAGLYLLTLPITTADIVARDLNLPPASAFLLLIGVHLVAAVAGAAAGIPLAKHHPNAVSAIAAGLVGIGALLDFLSPSAGILTAGRLLSGLGTGALVAVAVVLARRIGSRAAYVLAAVAAIAALAAGPLLGAVVASTLTWRLPFLIATPPAFIALVISAVAGIISTTRR